MQIKKAIIGWCVGKRNADTTLKFLYDLRWSRDRGQPGDFNGRVFALPQFDP